MSNIIISVDTGNKMMKTPNFVFSAGLTKHYGKEPVNVVDTEYLRVGKHSYTVSEQHIANVADKSSEPDYTLLVLIAIAKELNFAGIDKVKDADGVVRTSITLAMGLPISHYGRYQDNYKKAYRNGGKPYEFAFKPLGGKLTKYEITVNRVHMFPQGFAAAQSNAEVQGLVRSGSAIIIDVGGFTTDMCRVKDGRPTPDHTKTYNNMGMNTLYNEIANRLEDIYFVRVEDEAIERMLDDDKEVLGDIPKQAIEVARESAADFAKRLANTVIGEGGVDFLTNKVIFAGGGSLRLRPYITEVVKKRGGKPYFIDDIRANAIGYVNLATARERMRK